MDYTRNSEIVFCRTHKIHDDTSKNIFIDLLDLKNVI